ncbi:MAG: hypothetical protein CMH69_19515 [Nitratireductor sp.]|nr:hypothetical protein [Nitratireductor sp.]
MNMEVLAGISPRADWRDPENYRTVQRYDVFGWAGEWLLRNRKFLSDLLKAPCLLSFGDRAPVIECPDADCFTRWGACCCLIDGQPVLCWSPERNPLVLELDAVAAACREAGFDCKDCPLLKAVMRMGAEDQHVLFSDGARHLQLALSGADVLDGPLLLRCTLCGIEEFETKAILLRHLCGLYRHRRFLACLYPVERRARRWAEMLRAWDGADAGASQRDIAAVLFGERAATESWDDLYRTRIQRLLRGARRMVEGGYLKLLGRVREGEDDLKGAKG